MSDHLVLRAMLQMISGEEYLRLSTIEIEAEKAEKLARKKKPKPEKPAVTLEYFNDEVDDEVEEEDISRAW
jgi:hypothetical protein